MCFLSLLLSPPTNTYYSLSEISHFTWGSQSLSGVNGTTINQILVTLQECLLLESYKAFCMVMSYSQPRVQTETKAKMGSCHLKLHFSNSNLPIIYHVAPFFLYDSLKDTFKLKCKMYSEKYKKKGKNLPYGHSMSILFEEFPQIFMLHS